jgi:hypothetical protein
MTLFTDEDLGIESEFPCEYVPDFLPKEEERALHARFIDWLYCDRIIQKSGRVQRRKGVVFASNPDHTQVRGTYDEMLQTVDEDHCDGPCLPLSDAPEELHTLRERLSKQSGMDINFLAIVHYLDHTVQIDWHKHSEDDGCDTPAMIVSTGQTRPFHLGKQRRMPMLPSGKRKAPEPFANERSSKMAAPGSLIVLPSEFNYTHWHAILPERFPCGPRISVVGKHLFAPQVFSIPSQRFPRYGRYVGCKKGRWPATIYANDRNPEVGHYDPIAKTEAEFRSYAEKRMQNPAFRERAIRELRGKHLLCWCIQDGPGRAPFCHARIWRELLNK